MELSRNNAQAEASSLAARTAKLQTEVAQVRAKIETLNANQVRVAELEQAVELSHRNYLAHSDKLEQARIDGALQSDRISNVNIVQPASLEMKPASPRKGLVAATGLAIAMLGSVVIVVGGQRRMGEEEMAS